MPIGYSTDELLTCKIDAIDGGLPEDQRVTWYCRPLTIAEVRKVRALIVESDMAEKFDEQDAKLNEAIMLGVKRWSMPEPFDPAGMELHMTFQSKRDLAIHYPGALYLSELEKKVSRSSQASAPEK